MADLVLQDGPGRVELPLAALPREMLIAVPEMNLGDAPLPLRVCDDALEQVRLPEDRLPVPGRGVGSLLGEVPQRVRAPPRPGQIAEGKASTSGVVVFEGRIGV